MSKYVVEFVMKRSLEIDGSSVSDAIEQATTWVNHDEFREQHKLKDLGFKILGVKEVGLEGMDYGPRRD